jgi:hypothetical protein
MVLALIAGATMGVAPFIRKVQIFDAGSTGGSDDDFINIAIDAVLHDWSTIVEPNLGETNTAHIAVLCMAFGYKDGDGKGRSQLTRELVENLAGAGVVMAAAAPNDGESRFKYDYPSSLSTEFNQILSVGAVDNSGIYNKLSNNDPQISIWAPGIDIEMSKAISAVGGTVYDSGTSFSTYDPLCSLLHVAVIIGVES